MQTKKSLVSKLAVGLVLTGIAGASFAALPPAIATTVTDINSNAQSIFDLVFPVVGTVLGFVIAIKLFKKFVLKI